jgi:hypothetical protein
MALADVVTRFAQALVYLALFLALFNLPAFLLGESEILLFALVLLYLAPTGGSLIQLSPLRMRAQPRASRWVGCRQSPATGHGMRCADAGKRRPWGFG